MELFREHLYDSDQTDVMRADIYMEYHPVKGNGAAAVKWVPIASDDVSLRPFLVALLYARILVVHKEGREKLYWIVDELSKLNVRDEGYSGFTFPKWTLKIAAGAPDQHIWPFDIYTSPDSLSNPKVYEATLKAIKLPGANGSFDIQLDMPREFERILAPAAPLIAIKSFSDAADQEGRYELAILLWQINEFYASPGAIRIGSESKALATATAAIRSGNLSAPYEEDTPNTGAKAGKHVDSEMKNLHALGVIIAIGFVFALAVKACS